MKIPDGARCAWCGTTENLTRDHLVLRSEGGSNLRDNIRFLCRPGCHDLRHQADVRNRRELDLVRARNGAIVRAACGCIRGRSNGV